MRQDDYVSPFVEFDSAVQFGFILNGGYMLSHSCLPKSQLSPFISAKHEICPDGVLHALYYRLSGMMHLVMVKNQYPPAFAFTSTSPSPSSHSTHRTSSPCPSTSHHYPQDTTETSRTTSHYDPASHKSHHLPHVSTSAPPTIIPSHPQCVLKNCASSYRKNLNLVFNRFIFDYVPHLATPYS